MRGQEPSFVVSQHSAFIDGRPIDDPFSLISKERGAKPGVITFYCFTMTSAKAAWTRPRHIFCLAPFPAFLLP